MVVVLFSAREHTIAPCPAPAPPAQPRTPSAPSSPIIPTLRFVAVTDSPIPRPISANAATARSCPRAGIGKACTVPPANVSNRTPAVIDAYPSGRFRRSRCGEKIDPTVDAANSAAKNAPDCTSRSPHRAAITGSSGPGSTVTTPHTTNPKHKRENRGPRVGVIRMPILSLAAGNTLNAAP